MNIKAHATYIIAIILCGVIIFLLFHKVAKQSKMISNQQSIITEQSSEIVEKVNAEGRILIQKNAAIADLNQLKKAYPKLIQDINKKLEVKSKNLVAAMEAEFQATGSGTVNIIHDTVKIKGGGDYKRYQIRINDGYLKLDGVTKSARSVDYKYTYADTLLMSFSKTKSFFKGEIFTISGALQNPNAKITHTTGVIVERVKAKRFNLSVGFYYDPLRNQYGPAITAGYALLRF